MEPAEQTPGDDGPSTAASTLLADPAVPAQDRYPVAAEADDHDESHLIRGYD